MNLSGKLMPILIFGVIVLGIGSIAMRLMGGDPNITRSENISDQPLTLPQLSALATQGKTAFDTSCAECHGTNGAGTQKGPPLVYDTYNPGHHADEAFFRAVRMGVRQHHWPFGDMPPRPEVTGEQITAIVRYIREMQEANGIYFRQHMM